jgi:hypothetical protein
LAQGISPAAILSGGPQKPASSLSPFSAWLPPAAPKRPYAERSISTRASAISGISGVGEKTSSAGARTAWASRRRPPNATGNEILEHNLLEEKHANAAEHEDCIFSFLSHHRDPFAQDRRRTDLSKESHLAIEVGHFKADVP